MRRNQNDAGLYGANGKLLHEPLEWPALDRPFIAGPDGKLARAAFREASGSFLQGFRPPLFGPDERLIPIPLPSTESAIRLPEGPVEEGIFVGCLDVIFKPAVRGPLDRYHEKISGNIMIPNEEMIRFLNTQHLSGVRVTPLARRIDNKIREILLGCGLDPAIVANLQERNTLHGKRVRIYLDDPPYLEWRESFVADIHWDPDSPEFRHLLSLSPIPVLGQNLTKAIAANHKPSAHDATLPAPAAVAA